MGSGGIRSVRTEGAPAPVGPYSQGVTCSGMVFTAGQIGSDPATGILAEGVAAQAERALMNLAEVLKVAGSGLDKVIRVTIYLIRMSDFEEVNRVYSGFFDEPYPARSTVAVTGLPKGAMVEIEATAGLEERIC